jgi:hypothetical protein
MAHLYTFLNTLPRAPQKFQFLTYFIYMNKN